MRNYRLYWLDGSGRIESATVVDAPDDEQAIMQATETLDGGRGELWLGQRLVRSFQRNSDKAP